MNGAPRSSPPEDRAADSGGEPLSRSLGWLITGPALLGATALVIQAAARRVACLPDSPLSSDESLHAIWALATARDLAHGDLRLLLQETWAQDRWPFVGNFLQAPLLWLQPVAPASHRLATLAYLPVTLLVVYALAWRTAAQGSARLPWLAAALAVVLALSSPLFLSLAATAYLELYGILLMLLVYWLYLRAVAPAGPAATRPRAFWPAGAALLLALFLKWQYGLVAGGIVAGDLLLTGAAQEEARGWRRVARRLRSRRLWVLIGPAVVALGLWLLSPTHLREFLLYLSWIPFREGLPSWPQATFYARLITQGYAAGWASALLLALGAAYGLLRLRHRADRLLIVHAAFCWVSVSLKGQLNPRFGLWYVPPLWVLGGVCGARLAEYALGRRAVAGGTRRELVAPVLGVAAAGLALAAAFHVAPLLGPPSSYDRVTRAMRPVYDFLAARISAPCRVLTVGGWETDINPNTLRWHLLAVAEPRLVPVTDVQVCDMIQVHWPEDEVRIDWRWPWELREVGVSSEKPSAPEAPYVVIFEGTEALPQEAWEEQRRTVLERRPYDLVVRRKFPGGIAATIYRAATAPAASPH